LPGLFLPSILLTHVDSGLALHGRFSNEVRRQAEAQGTLDTLYEVIEPISLDRLMDETRQDSCHLQEVVAHASPCSPSQDDVGKRDQVDQLLSYLAPRAQTAVRLRYGLYYENDERPRSYPEIAAVLGISRGAVSSILGDAMKRLRALVRGEAWLFRKNGKVCIWLTPAKGRETQKLLASTKGASKDAKTVQHALGQDYTLDTVDVKISEEVQHG
jgi:DNA-directed RNA polymerase specialized sigma24 family protein